MGSSGKPLPLCDLGFSICKAGVVPLLSDEAGIRGHIKFLALGPPPTHLQAARGPTPRPPGSVFLICRVGPMPTVSPWWCDQESGATGRPGELFVVPEAMARHSVGDTGRLLLGSETGL